MIVFASNIVAYILIGYSERSEELTQGTIMVMNINHLHTCNNNTMKPLADFEKGELLCSTSNARPLLLHPMVVSYVADISKTKYLLSVERGNYTVMPFHIYNT